MSGYTYIYTYVYVYMHIYISTHILWLSILYTVAHMSSTPREKSVKPALTIGAQSFNSSQVMRRTGSGQDPVVVERRFRIHRCLVANSRNSFRSGCKLMLPRSPLSVPEAALNYLGNRKVHDEHEPQQMPKHLGTYVHVYILAVLAVYCMLRSIAHTRMHTCLPNVHVCVYIHIHINIYLYVHICIYRYRYTDKSTNTYLLPHQRLKLAHLMPHLPGTPKFLRQFTHGFRMAAVVSISMLYTYVQ